MSAIPRWDSIAGANWWSNFYFWASIFALILLGITEVVSHRYSERHDELSAIEQEATKKANDDEIARLHSDAASANERAGILENEAAQARLELSKLKQPRDVDFGAFNRAMAGVSVGRIEIEYGSGTDSPWLAQRLTVAFGALGWQIPEGMAGLPHAVKPDDSELCKIVSPIECMGGQQFGVTVLTHSPPSEADKVTQSDLMRAVGIGIGAVGMFGSEHPSVPPGTIRILIGARS